MFQIVRECCAYLQLSEPLCNGAIVLVVHLHCSSHHLAHLTYPLHLALHLLENNVTFSCCNVLDSAILAVPAEYGGSLGSHVVSVLSRQLFGATPGLRRRVRVCETRYLIMGLGAPCGRD
ncbi:hypothetical protein EYF80_015104 [Liparis tanakae]|uniref:Uncharacterized protein n=1 Tax=Liparis tanakae TaxID=230148 RepID=A0A4Z2I9E6_9TELE|nr:hypothetical protein EYF80_015104 [Liparis tanakae]